MNGLDLFSGIGGMSFALSEWARPAAYCEIDAYCQGVLLSRMADESLPNSPIWDDITTLQGQPFNGGVDIIYGGFPCQDISIAGIKKGLDGKRSSLFYHFLRLVHEIKPQFVFIENVAHICKIGGNKIIEEFSQMGMECRWCCISARSIGAPHKRDRWFMLAYDNCKSSGETYQASEFISPVRDAWLRSTRQIRRDFAIFNWKESECPSFAMDDGIPFELEQARALGNSVVPKQAREAFKILMGLT